MKSDSTIIRFTLPLEVVSEANQRGHWAKHHKRKQAHRWIACQYTKVWLWTELGGRVCVVTLTRVKGPRQRDFDDDNLRSAFKAIRDGIADAIGIDDGSKGIRWEYAQERRGGSLGCVAVKIERLEGAAGMEARK